MPVGMILSRYPWATCRDVFAPSSGLAPPASLYGGALSNMRLGMRLQATRYFFLNDLYRASRIGPPSGSWLHHFPQKIIKNRSFLRTRKSTFSTKKFSVHDWDQNLIFFYKNLRIDPSRTDGFNFDRIGRGVDVYVQSVSRGVRGAYKKKKRSDAVSARNRRRRKIFGG